MQRLIEQQLCRTLFYKEPFVHYCYFVGQKPNQSYVVRNKQYSHARFLFPFEQGGQKRGLDGPIQGSRRLVSHKDLWVQSQGPSQSHSLALPTGKLVRPSVQEF
jgi:hypothetical protein